MLYKIINLAIYYIYNNIIWNKNHLSQFSLLLIITVILFKLYIIIITPIGGVISLWPLL